MVFIVSTYIFLQHLLVYLCIYFVCVCVCAHLHVCVCHGTHVLVPGLTSGDQAW